MVMTNRKIRDEELVALARAGHTDAFNQLVLRYREKIYRLARRLTHTQEDAEDVLQEAFIKAYRSLGDFEGRSLFYTWLYRVTVNLALAKLRRDRGRFVSLDEPIETGHGPIKRDLPAHGPDPLTEIIRREDNGILDKAINELPATSRAVFKLRHMEGLSTRSTGRILNLSESATKSRLHRARNVLSEKLMPMMDDRLEAAYAADAQTQEASA